MKHSTAIEHLRTLMLVLQKYRSATAEELPELTDDMKATMWPWVFGDKCPLSALSKIIADADSGKQIAPMDYYNMMFILDRFMPEIKVAAAVYDMKLPDGPPSMRIVAAGWDEEE